MPTTDIVQKLWNLCHVLRDDGITYHQYVTELTSLLFLKMMKETAQEKNLPQGYRWDDLAAREASDQLTFYREMLRRLGSKGTGHVQAIFAQATTSLEVPHNLKKLVDAVDELDWYSARTEGLGDLYEGLLEKNGPGKKTGPGQYFTPRPLIDSIVFRIQPQPGERVQDPAAGTAGFLIAADRYVKARSNHLRDLPPEMQAFQKKRAFYGVELVPDTHRLALMNLMLHDIEGNLFLGDALSELGAKLEKADVILTNPPFGAKKGGGLPTRGDFDFPTSNKQLAFLQHVFQGLQPKGRAAVIVPDNVLFEEKTGTDVRRELMDKCDLHTILRLPTGIFYAPTVKTNVLFFHRGTVDKGNTKAVWVYDMRANRPSFGKRTPLMREHFADFERAYGTDPWGKSQRRDQGPTGRFRRFTREEIRARGDNLDLSWLEDQSMHRADDLPEPEKIADEILEKLRIAVEEIEGLKAELRGSA